MAKANASVVHKTAGKAAHMRKKAAYVKKVTTVSFMKPMCQEVYDETTAVYKKQLPEKYADISITMQIAGHKLILLERNS